MWKFIKSLFIKKYNYAIAASYDEKKQLMTIEYTNHTIEHYHGSSTVWYQLPSFKRCETSKESWLCEVYTKIKYDEKETKKN